MEQIIEHHIGKLQDTNPAMYKAMQEIAEIHNKKSNDYAQEDNPFDNFERTARMLRITVEDVFLLFIATKLNRIVNLNAEGVPPENESVMDSRLDLATYAMLYYAYMRED